MVTSSSRAEHFSVWVVLGVLAVAAIGGLLAGWYEQINSYDEVVHGWFGFSVSFAAGVWLSNKAPSLRTNHRASFAFVIIGIGLGIGAAWEILEFAYDHLSGDRNLILGKFDTMIDLLCDLGGAALAAVLLPLRGMGHRTRS